MINKDMTIVFIGFDGYSDLWDDCFKLFNMFYKDNTYRTLFINNTKEVSYPGIETFHAGEDAEWSKKVCDSVLPILKELYPSIVLTE